jgi:hypothetical protein
MSTFRRLLGTAQKALDTQTSGSARPGQGSDWRSLVRSAADHLTGDSTRAASSDSQPQRHAPSDAARSSTRPAAPGSFPAGAQGDARSTARAAASPDLSAEDRRAIARYDYLVRTAEPDQLERVHREAFEKLTPHQRAQLTATMRSELPEGERPRTDAPQDLARSATRLGALDPRRLTRLLGRSGGGGRGGLGAGVVAAGAVGAGGLLTAVAGGAVVTAVGGSLLQEAVGAGIDVDSLAPDLAGDLGGFTEGFEGMDGMADGVGGAVTDAGEQFSGLGDRISDLGLGDLFGR